MNSGRGDGIRRFYAANTRRFVRFGQGRDALHRAVWLPGLRRRRDAFHSVDRRMLDLLAELPGEIRVLDLGCGTGATLRYLAEHRSLTGIGVTIDAGQVQVGRDLAIAGGQDARLTFLVADFESLPEAVPVCDAAIAIESFVHARERDAFFASASSVVRIGGRLVVCDDFLGPPVATTVPDLRDERLVQSFRWGWRADSLSTVAEVEQSAASSGFQLVYHEDLSPWLELGRPRDRLISVTAPLLRRLARRHEYPRALVGGDALQRCLKRGIIHYRLLCFARLPDRN